ncbi:Mor transcription activator family protein [Fulvimonas yonginensis]|uniref:Mor transcription activator family protein n=1 Tax=Fulvimonas yonginensis TaxID=1495200 RepID=A0ABU8JAZ9_9GAMM
MGDMFETAPVDATLAGIEAPSDNWPSMLAELVDVLRATFQRRGRSEAEAITEAQQAAMAIGEYLGGRQVYLPRGDRLRDWLRDRTIYLEYNGRNKALLAQRHGITERRVEQIAAEQRAIHIRRIQPELFPR